MVSKIQRLCPGEKIYEEHLGQASIKGSLWGLKAQGSQHSGQCRKRHTQVINRQQRQEVVHWLVQVLLLLCDEEN